MGAFNSVAFFSKIEWRDGGKKPIKTGVSGLIIPAFSNAISSNDVPRIGVWSNPIEVIMDKIGLNVLIKNKKNNAGKIIFEYKDLDQLNKIIEIIKSNY